MNSKDQNSPRNARYITFTCLFMNSFSTCLGLTLPFMNKEMCQMDISKVTFYGKGHYTL